MKKKYLIVAGAFTLCAALPVSRGLFRDFTPLRAHQQTLDQARHLDLAVAPAACFYTPAAPAPSPITAWATNTFLPDSLFPAPALTTPASDFDPDAAACRVRSPQAIRAADILAVSIFPVLRATDANACFLRKPAPDAPIVASYSLAPALSAGPNPDTCTSFDSFTPSTGTLAGLDTSNFHLTEDPHPPSIGTLIALADRSNSPFASPVPEPSSLLLIASGTLSIASLLRFRRNKLLAATSAA